MRSSKKSKREEFQVLSVVKAGLISGRSIKLSLSRNEAPLEKLAGASEVHSGLSVEIKDIGSISMMIMTFYDVVILNPID